MADQEPTRLETTRKVTLVGAGVNALLALAQLLGGVFTHSQGLIADGIHTLADLASDFIVLLAAHEAHREADDEHPYGHGRIETLATSLLGMGLIIVGLGIGYDAGNRLLHPERLLHPTPLALLFAALAVFSKEGLYHYTRRVARSIRSSMLEANAWHHRSDAISSLLVIVGISGSLMGFKGFDAYAAIAVALFIIHIGGQLLWQSSQELIDASLDDEVLKQTEAVIQNVDGVVNMHLLRTRKSGGDAFADVHIQVPAKISVSEGHQIAESVRKAIVTNIDEITDVTVHTDPEDDAANKPCAHLPLRDEIVGRLRRLWVPLELYTDIDKINLHYLDGQIDIDVYLPVKWAGNPDGVLDKLESLAKSLPEIRKVSIYFTREDAP
jgi:cation diffusion facilitator family transporter